MDTTETVLTENGQSKEHKRKLYYDYVRIVAILMVLYNHRPGFSIANHLNSLTIKNVILALLSTACKCGPPLFLMVSGALLLQKRESFKYVLKHRILRIVAVLFICSLMMTWPTWEIERIAEAFFGGANWYLYAYLGYLFMLPFLRLILLNISEKEANTFFYLSFVFYTLSGIVLFYGKSISLLNKTPFYNAKWASDCWHLLFPILGALIETNKLKINKKWIHCGAFISLVISAVFIIYDVKLHGGENVEMMRQHWIFLPVCSLFLLLKDVSENNWFHNKDCISKVIKTLSETTFGVFLIDTHTTFSSQIFDSIQRLFGSYMGNVKLSFISVFVELFLYSMIIYVLRLIPGVKKFI